MLTENEIKEKLERLKEVKIRRTPPSPNKCPTCGLSDSLAYMSTWMFGDHYYLDAEIAALEWVLGIQKHLMEDHT